MNQQMSAFLTSSMKLGGLGGIKPGEFKIIASEPAKKDARPSRVLTGKAMLVVDCGYTHDPDGGSGYSTRPIIKTAIGDYPDDAYVELAHFGTSQLVIPNQCWRMNVGDRWRVDVVYRLTYEPTVDSEGNEDWEVNLEFIKAKTRSKSPWNKKRHTRYVSKAKRALEQVAVGS